ncbi:hypothetical protein HAX54_006110 [Datura stramonium]|uniref:Uncharacterized protein n=1 Tax=Datura stramonium TaxID=4076 RepID=A0ABS8TB60_DATST|nr:hypothetical protein [Datura stramonium]
MLSTWLCRQAHVPILAGIDVDTYVIKKYDLEKSKDESRYDLKLHKTICDVRVQWSNCKDRAIIAALELYKNLHARVDDMEVRVNDRLKDLTVQIWKELQTLVIPPPATEAAPTDPFKATVSTDVTVEVPGVTPP